MPSAARAARRRPRTRVIVLAALIALAALIGLVVLLVRFTSIGQPGAIGTPLPSGAPAAAGWQSVADAPFARLEMATAVHDGRIWLAGGFMPDGSATDELWIFEPSTGTWSEGPPLPEAVHHAALASDGSRLLLVGGYAGEAGEATTATQALDPATGSWVAGPALPEPLGAGALAFDGQRFVYAGGLGPAGVSDQVMALDSIDAAWRVIGTLTRPREHLAAATDGRGATWFLGGRQGGLDTNLEDVDLVRDGTVTALSAVSPRGGVAAFFAPGIGACLTGGESPGRAFTTVECVDDTGRTTALPSMRQPRHGHGIGVVDGVAYALLGGLVPGLDARSSVESLQIGG